MHRKPSTCCWWLEDGGNHVRRSWGCLKRLSSTGRAEVSEGVGPGWQQAENCGLGFYKHKKLNSAHHGKESGRGPRIQVRQPADTLISAWAVNRDTPRWIFWATGPGADKQGVVLSYLVCGDLLHSNRKFTYWVNRVSSWSSNHKANE